MKILYLTWGETPRSYGVFGSQVIGQVVENSMVMSDSCFYFVSAVPFIHSGLVREKWKYFSELKKVKEKLGNIPFKQLSIYAPQNLVNSDARTFRWVHAGTHVFLRKLVDHIKPELLHCRSYHAAWAALCIKRKYNLNFRIVFDARGLWPEEVSLKRHFPLNGRDYTFLKHIELELLKNCDVTVSVSDSMTCHYHQLGVKRVETIYLSANVKRLFLCAPQNKTTDLINFCYVGALSKDAWHCPAELSALFREILVRHQNAKLTIITTSNKDALLPYFYEFAEKVEFTSTYNESDLANLLNKMDVGVLPYRATSGLYEELVGKTMLATKTVEYLVAGLPVLVNRRCEGISALVQKYNLGVSYDPVTFDGLDLPKLRGFFNLEQRNNIANVAAELFDGRKHAEQYRDLYRSLVK